MVFSPDLRYVDMTHQPWRLRLRPANPPSHDGGFIIDLSDPSNHEFSVYGRTIAEAFELAGYRVQDIVTNAMPEHLKPTSIGAALDEELGKLFDAARRGRGT